jgi:hypothetical protein
MTRTTFLRRRRVHATALEARVDDRAEPDPRDEARPAGGRLAIEMGDHALRKAVGLDLPVARERAQRRDEPPVRADRAPDKFKRAAASGVMTFARRPVVTAPR